MSKREPKKELVGPWRSVHAAIWLVGLYLLFSRGWFFPGIFVLIAISAIYEALLARYAPHAYEEKTPGGPESPVVDSKAPVTDIPPAVSTSATPLVQEHRLELLPAQCPACSAPIRGRTVKWTGRQSADCPYCGTNLPMSKA